jgi:methanethiol S-methyltransferase
MTRRDENLFLHRMGESHITLGIFWMLYCSLHSILASFAVKEKAAPILGRSFKFYRLFYSLFAFLGLVAILIYNFSIPSPLLFIPVNFLKILAAILALSGLLIMFICIRKYFLQSSGLRILYRENESSELMIKGIHRFVRHPLYGGTFLFIWGIFLFFPYLSFLIANVMITIYSIIAIRFEEVKLVKQFGESYLKYQRDTPMLIPGRRYF